jgi:hypothetical protein
MSALAGGPTSSDGAGGDGAEDAAGISDEERGTWTISVAGQVEMVGDKVGVAETSFADGGAALTTFTAIVSRNIAVNMPVSVVFFSRTFAGGRKQRILQGVQ